MAADRITVNLGFTKNMGDFNSLRVDIEYGSDAKDGESLTEHFDRVFNFVDDNIGQALNEAAGSVKRA